MKNWKIVFVLLLVAYNSLEAQNHSFSFQVKGKVIDNETLQPLEYVNVILYSARDSSLVSGTITSANGSFDLKVARPGKFYMAADFIGFERSFVDNFVVKPGQELYDIGEVRIKASVVGIDAIEVVAEKPFVSYQLDKKVVDVSKNPSAQGGTAVDALENIPSVQTDIEGNVSLRGSSNFTVLIDGRQSPLTGTDALNQIPASAIDKIEIITNPSVKYDPDGTTGIINIISKKGKLKGHALVVNTNLGNSPTYGSNLTYSYRKEKMTFTGGLSYHDSRREMHRSNDQYINYMNGITEETDSVVNLKNVGDGKGSHKNAGVKAGIDYRISDANVFNIGISYNDFSFSRSSGSKVTNYTGTPYQTNRISSNYYTNNPYSWQVNIGDKHVFDNNQQHYLSIDATYQTGTGTQTNGIESRITDRDWNIIGQDTLDQKTETSETSKRYRIEANYMQPFGEKFFLEAGYTLRADISDQDYRALIMDPENQQWGYVPDLNDQSKYSRYINAGWALVKGQALGLNLSGGLRLEHTDRNVETTKDNYKFNYNYLGCYPSFAVSKDFGNGNTLQASYSKRINRPRPWHLNPFPRLSDGYSVFRTNPELEPEDASAYELNFQKSLGGISFLSLETFYHNTKNKIERLRMTENDTLFIYTVTNQGHDQRIGAELGGHIKVNKWFSFMPGITAYYYKLNGYYLGQPKVVTSSLINGQLTGNFMFPTKTRMQLMGYFRGAQEEIDEQEDAMYWMSAAVRQEFLDRKLGVTLRVDDIFASRKRTGTVFSENSMVKSERYRKSPIFILSVSLKLNQNMDKKAARSEEYNSGGANNSGGMDMDF
jgi:outer membrane receptor protein involved in Fe transport